MPWSTKDLLFFLFSLSTLFKIFASQTNDLDLLWQWNMCTACLSLLMAHPSFGFSRTLQRAGRLALHLLPPDFDPSTAGHLVGTYVMCSPLSKHAYVGQTSRSYLTRFKEHHHQVKTPGPKQSPVYPQLRLLSFFHFSLIPLQPFCHLPRFSSQQHLASSPTHQHPLLLELEHYTITMLSPSMNRRRPHVPQLAGLSATPYTRAKARPVLRFRKPKSAHLLTPTPIPQRFSSPSLPGRFPTLTSLLDRCHHNRCPLPITVTRSPGNTDQTDYRGLRQRYGDTLILVHPATSPVPLSACSTTLRLASTFSVISLVPTCSAPDKLFLTSLLRNPSLVRSLYGLHPAKFFTLYEAAASFRSPRTVEHLRHRLCEVFKSKWHCKLDIRPTLSLPSSCSLHPQRMRHLLKQSLSALPLPPYILRWLVARARLVYNKGVSIGDLLCNHRQAANTSYPSCPCHRFPWLPKNAEGHVFCRGDHPSLPDSVRAVTATHLKFIPSDHSRDRALLLSTAVQEMYASIDDYYSLDAAYRFRPVTARGYVLEPDGLRILDTSQVRTVAHIPVPRLTWLYGRYIHGGHDPSRFLSHLTSLAYRYNDFCCHEHWSVPHATYLALHQTFQDLQVHYFSHPLDVFTETMGYCSPFRSDTAFGSSGSCWKKGWTLSGCVNPPYSRPMIHSALVKGSHDVQCTHEPCRLVFILPGWFDTSQYNGAHLLTWFPAGTFPFLHFSACLYGDQLLDPSHLQAAPFPVQVVIIQNPSAAAQHVDLRQWKVFCKAFHGAQHFSIPPPNLPFPGDALLQCPLPLISNDSKVLLYKNQVPTISFAEVRTAVLLSSSATVVDDGPMAVDNRQLTRRDVVAVKHLLEELTLSPMDRNPGGLFISCPVVYQEALQGAFASNAHYEKCEMPSELVIDEMSQWYRQHQLTRVAKFDTKGTFCGAYVLFKHKNPCKCRPIVPAYLHPMRASLKLGAAVWNKLIHLSPWSRESFNICSTSELAARVQKWNELGGDASVMQGDPTLPPEPGPPDPTTLLGFDICNMFTTLPHADIMSCIEEFLTHIHEDFSFDGMFVHKWTRAVVIAGRNPAPKRYSWVPLSKLIPLAHGEMSYTYFRLSGTHLVHQKDGLSMGGFNSPVFAQILTIVCERRWLHNLGCLQHRIFAVRYMDDLSMLIRGNTTTREFIVQSYMTACYPAGIQVEMEQEGPDEVVMLESKLSLAQGKLSCVYWNKESMMAHKGLLPTQWGIHNRSCVPIGIKKGWVSGELCRMIDATAPDSIPMLGPALVSLALSLMALDYPLSFIARVVLGPLPPRAATPPATIVGWSSVARWARAVWKCLTGSC